MSSSQDQAIPASKACKTHSISKYPVKYPTAGFLPLKNFNIAVNFHTQEKLPCKNTWYRDIKSTHIRNKRLLDLPYKIPKCCSDIYNVVLDRQKLKKLKKYGLTRPVRVITHGLELELEEVEVCKSEQETEDTDTIIFPECLEIKDSSSDGDDEEEDEYEVCPSGSVSECSGCSAFGAGYMRQKFHKVIKKDIAGLLRSEANEICKAAIADELKKHKLGRDFPLRLDRVFDKRSKR